MGIALLTTPAPAASSEVPIPEFFGIYVVADGKLFGIDVPQSTMTPKKVSVPIGQRTAVADILEGKVTATSRSVELPEFPANVQFLIFIQTGGSTTPMAVGNALHLRGLVFVRNMSVDTGIGSGVKRTSPENAWESGDANDIGGTETDITKQATLLMKPVPDHNDMVLVVPSAPLSPGVYSLGAGPTSGPLAKGRFHFVVGPVTQGATEKCVDVKCKYMMMTSRCQATRCGEGAQPTSVDAASGSGTNAPEPNSVIAQLSEKEPYTSNFKTYAREFPAPFEQVWQAVDKALQKQKDKIAVSDRSKGIVVTELATHGFFLDPRRVKYYIQVENLGSSSSRVSVKLLRYDRDVHKGGPFDVVLIPEPKEQETTKQAKSFLDEIQKYL